MDLKKSSEQNQPVKCIGGPFAGETLYLSHRKTAVFMVKYRKGFYENGRWVEVP